MKTLLLTLALAFGTRLAYADGTVCQIGFDPNSAVEEMEGSNVACVVSYVPDISSDDAATVYAEYDDFPLPPSTHDGGLQYDYQTTGQDQFSDAYVIYVYLDLVYDDDSNFLIGYYELALCYG